MNDKTLEQSSNETSESDVQKKSPNDIGQSDVTDDQPDINAEDTTQGDYVNRFYK